MKQTLSRSVERPSIRPRLFERLTTAPNQVPRRMARYHVYWRTFYFLAGLVHLAALIGFANREIWLLVYFNFYSVPAFLFCVLLVHRQRYRLAYWIAITELMAHAVLSTACLGPDWATLTNAAMVALILVFIQPFYPLSRTLLIAVGVLALAGVTQAYILQNPPIYPGFSQTVAESTFRVVMWPSMVLAMVAPFIRAADRAERELEVAYDQSERLLLNILPGPVAERLKSSESMIADQHDRVAIMFIDLVGFTETSRRLEPAQIVTMLNRFFFAIDDLVEKHGTEKIKTIGDAYMIAAGVPEAVPDPESRIAALALDIVSLANKTQSPETGRKLEVRIGAHAGTVVAGVIGKNKFAYDMWGDAVNLAARMESSGEPGRIQVSDDFAGRLDGRFQLEDRGSVAVKGYGNVNAHFLVGRSETPKHGVGSQS